jgi:hypothetical protein
LRAFLKKPKIKQQKPKPNQKILCPYNVTVELSNEKKKNRRKDKFLAQKNSKQGTGGSCL